MLVRVSIVVRLSACPASTLASISAADDPSV